MKPTINKVPVEPVHDSFKLGQGYASGENGSEAEENVAFAQFGDKYEDTDEVQPVPDEELEDIAGTDSRKKTNGKNKNKLKKYHH
jgi:hypothetical protein